MLKMEEIARIKKYRSQGKSKRAICRETGHAWDTVTKYIEQKDFNIYPKKRKPRKTKLDGYRKIIDKWLLEDQDMPRKQRHTATRVHARLQEKYGDDFAASYRTVAYYVKEARARIDQESKACFLDLDHKPGEAQVDFGQANFLEKNKKIKGHYLVMSFPYSNAEYCQVFKGENQECFLEGMKRIFERIGRVPKEIWFDNLSAAVTIKKGQRKMTDRFKRFMLHYGFEAHFCNVNKGNEKGHVENKVGYVRRNLFVPLPEFKDIDEYNGKLLDQCEEHMKEEHYKKEVEIKQLFQTDLEHMKLINAVPFDTSKTINISTDNYGYFKLSDKTYSTGGYYKKSELLARVSHDQVLVLNQDYDIIVEHPRLYGDQQESILWQPYLKLIAKRPNALKYVKFYDTLPYNWQAYLSGLKRDDKKEALRILSEILLEHDLDIAEQALAYNLENNVTDVASILTTYYKITDQLQGLDQVNLPESVPEIESFQARSQDYNHLMAEGVEL